MKEIAKDGNLTIPLYHGTSSIFLDSIFKFGLNGKNVISEWNWMRKNKRRASFYQARRSRTLFSISKSIHP